MPTIIENGNKKHLTVEEFNAMTEKRKASLPINPDGSWKGIKAENLDEIIINGESFRGISDISSVNTKVYVEEPGRANDGSMPDIGEYDTFFVPRCKVTFKYFTIADYQRFCIAVLPNEFLVEYFDKQFGKRVTHMMTYQPPDMDKIHYIDKTILGVLDFEITLVGALNETVKYIMQYNPNGAMIKNFRGEYSDSAVYHFGDRILFEGIYKEAIYYENTFHGIAPPNTTYWENIIVSEWDKLSTYRKDDVVKVTSSANPDNIVYYTAVFEGTFSGKPINDQNYWLPITIGEYNESQTYQKGNVIKKDGLYFRAIYYKDDFTGKSPIDFEFWADIPELNGESITWGKAIHLISPENLFAQPEGKVFERYNSRPDGGGFNYYPNQNTTIFDDLILYAIWRNV